MSEIKEIEKVATETSTSTPIRVVKRDGRKENLDYEKINQVLIWATEGISSVSASDVAMNAELQLFDGIKTAEIHLVLIESASNMITEDTPNYQYVAANLLNYYIRKEIFGSGGDTLPSLLELVNRNVGLNVYDKQILEWYTEEEFDKCNSYIRHQRDYNYTYAGLQQMVDKYLLKNRNTGELYETPQFAYMLVAMTLYKNEDKDNRLNMIRSYYNDLSKFKISIATPVMAGVRTNTRQYSSCVLIDCGDTTDSITSTASAVMKYTSMKAGIGLNMSRLRSVGSEVRNGEVIHTGVIPFMKIMESSTKGFSQGIRGGSATTYFPFWHHEVMDVMILKNNKGTDDNRVKKLDYNIQFNKLFYKRFLEKKDITLFSPHEVPEVFEAFYSNDIDKFIELYEKAERKTSIKKKKITARDLMNLFIQERIGTGRIYAMNIDHVNTHSAFKDPITMSNLCVEITLPTSPMNDYLNTDDSGEIALCVLSAINLGTIKELSDLEGISENIVRSLDNVIEHQDYPVKAAEKMLKRRSIGVGVTNLAYWMAKNNLSYNSTEDLARLDELFEAVQYYLLKASNKLAKEKGACEWFDRTTYSDGVLPIDTYNKNVDSLVPFELRYDWESLRESIKTYGLRNSTLTAQMPCESSSLITNSTNGIEPVRSLIIAKQSKAGILSMVVPEFSKLKNKYTKAFDVSNSNMNNIVAVQQKWFDQAISLNHYYDVNKRPDKKISMSEVTKDVLNAYKLGIKTLYYANTEDGSTDDYESNMGSGCEGGACSI